jgi:hypothetical protein
MRNKCQYIVQTICFILVGLHTSFSFGQVTIDLDLRSSSDPNQYYIAFISRQTTEVSTGHAYVAWGVEDEEQLMSVGDAFGFNPAEDVGGRSKEGFWKALIGVDGVIEDEQSIFAPSDVNNHFLVRVNKDAYDSSRIILQDWIAESFNGELEFELFIKNCITFTNEVAEHIGLKTSVEYFQYPEEYLNELINLNRVPVIQKQLPNYPRIHSVDYGLD